MDKLVAFPRTDQSHPTPLLSRPVFLLAIIWLIVIGIGGCASTPGASTAYGKTIAVMPLDNQTNSVAGTLYMREKMVDLLKRKGYAPLSIRQTDQMLANQFGISIGGQIAEEDLAKIAAGLGVAEIMTGRLKKFGAILLTYNEVSASFTLYNADARQTWSYDRTVITPFSPLRSDDIGVQLIGGLISNILERSFGAPLQDAVSRYYQQLQYTLPSGRNTYR